jgi:hypothetical protein
MAIRFPGVSMSTQQLNPQADQIKAALAQQNQYLPGFGGGAPGSWENEVSRYKQFSGVTPGTSYGGTATGLSSNPYLPGAPGVQAGGQPTQYGYSQAPGGAYGYYEQQTPAGSFAAANQQNAGVTQANTTTANNSYIGQTGANTAGGTATAGKNPMFGMNNPYLNSAINNASQDAVRNYETFAAPMRDRQAARAGSFGNSGVQQMQLDDQRNLQGTLGNIATGARMQDYAMQFGGGENQANRDTGVSQFNANLSQQDLARNAQLAQQQGMFNAGALNQGSMFNAGAQNQGNMFNAGQGNALNQFNTGQANQMLEGGRNREQNRYMFDENLDFNINNANFDQGIRGINTAQGLYNNMVQNGILQNQLGSEDSNAQLDHWLRLMGGASQGGGLGGTSSQPTYSDPWSQGLGTYAMLNSLMNPRRT